MAVVSEMRWEKGIPLLVKPFTAEEVRFFDPDELEKAKAMDQPKNLMVLGQGI